MRNRVTIAMFGALLAATPALAQTTTTGTTTTGTTTTTTTTGTTGTVSSSPVPPSTNQGAFTKLSPGNQKIAQALYDAQVAPAPVTKPTTTTTATTTGTTSTGTTPTRLTLDQIAAMKQGGQGWGQVFKEMKAQGLVTSKNLGQVVSASHRGSTTTVSSTGSYNSTGPVVTNAAGSTTVAQSSDHGSSAASHGSSAAAKGSSAGVGNGGGNDGALAGVTGAGNAHGAGAVARGHGKDK
jgi:hypothetical protein